MEHKFNFQRRAAGTAGVCVGVVAQLICISCERHQTNLTPPSRPRKPVSITVVQFEFRNMHVPFLGLKIEIFLAPVASFFVFDRVGSTTDDSYVQYSTHCGLVVDGGTLVLHVLAEFVGFSGRTIRIHSCIH